MFHTLTNVQSAEAVSLQQNINNQSGNLRAGLTSVTYTVGWYNVGLGETFRWRTAHGDEHLLRIPAGLYGLAALRSLLTQTDTGISLEVSTENGFVTLTVPTGLEARFSSGLQSKLGLPQANHFLSEGTYKGITPINMALTTALFVHLEQISTSQNFLDGSPSTLLDVVSLTCGGFGENSTVYIPSPGYRPLQKGIITELEVSVRDSYGRKVDNNGLPISVCLKIV